ncbi:UDP-N-acetylmuramoylalanyl-D-glutamate--2,6-diaminopimelate ligase [Panacagrimonas perspica]|uniref:UDP-N-acetylmuramoyl-L-alanyl-D-glutamate--2,6-diaminopimelate ligase n=1 Tax=Panacagrimonas perspica TaxID=381431 RepID=A0A4S3K277_9GAMM|nr:UDP-N-acetylmuramoyl-L-alanyl-D-glutamate--2,6-diaminopimelate ligase [Panacagrimonas perspica]TDU26440.1 UDP-N-acetylmuramoylalanyl-D-glutamate--2,6-diaminopimelate ligase [Panacagrimonas perspica]THD02062.1 UDP-N-acetylmuramoyl-L-alanyl-D-glutamate--2,6-diaminopimelate ligase [Panacagrimonas perspica]
MSFATREHSLEGLLAGFASSIPPLAVTGLALDSRRVNAGDAFLAVRGSREHGLAHLPQALVRGAGAILWEPANDAHAPQTTVPCVAVDQLGARVGEIAARFYGRPADRMYVAGVTGTDGKTSTAHLIAQAFEQLGRPCAYLGTLGTGRLASLDVATHTTPDPIALHARLADFEAEGVDACAMEVSSHALDQNRVGGVSFDAVVLTNLSRDHLDYHGTIERYAAAKRRLFESDDARALILNRDDAQGAQWMAQIAATSRADRLCAYGLDGATPSTAHHVIGRDLRLHENGLSLELDTHQGHARLDCALLGRFNAYNLLAAAAVLLESGLGLDAVLAALRASRTVPGRIEGFRGATSGPLVVVDYAHTPKALEQILSAVRAHTRGRLVCVFGCGGDRDAGKRPLMGEVAARLADRAIVTDDNPRSESPASIAGQILAGVDASMRDKLSVEHDRARAIRAAVAEATSGDVVLVAGKGHETTQTYGRDVREFSDRAFVAHLLGASA